MFHVLQVLAPTGTCGQEPMLLPFFFSFSFLRCCPASTLFSYKQHFATFYVSLYDAKCCLYEKKSMLKTSLKKRGGGKGSNIGFCPQVPVLAPTKKMFTFTYRSFDYK